MGMQINTNVSALNTYRNLTNTQNSLSKSLEKLSSGLRINRASDDAAGLTIAEGLKSQIGGLNVAARNAQDGISVVQVAEGALGEAQSILQRLRDLAVQAGNDSNSTGARDAISKEATSLTDELTRISNSTNFNGKKLLDGNAGTLKFQVGASGDANSQIDVAMTDLKSIASNLGAAGAKFDVLTPTEVTGAMKFTNGTTDVTVTLGGAGTYKTVGDVADALNKDANFATNFSASVNDDNQLVVTSKAGGTVSGGAAGAAAAPGTGIDEGTAVAGGLSFSTADEAQAAIRSIDAQLTAVSTARSNFGALQNRFESAINTINVSVENLSASKSRITDVDMAAEMVNFTRANILSQSGTSMLAQANQMPQMALKLLG
ncbi:flagellin [Naasia sp. SYSU D00057]|uniref:flagellin N-terminal helical domain-containing protein n=1 Tax=Naasia sp. SYSU D00057 TaxID=2817380 RepID=UPI001B310210|nr:flagellin [Naasia sp. SYSU D00057]